MKKRVKHCIESCRFIHLFLCFVLVSGECSAFALFRTVVKLIMLYYSCFARKSVHFQALFCRLQNVFIIIRKIVIQHLRRSNKNGSPCIYKKSTKCVWTREQQNNVWQDDCEHANKTTQNWPLIICASTFLITWIIDHNAPPTPRKYLILIFLSQCSS